MGVSPSLHKTRSPTNMCHMTVVVRAYGYGLLIMELDNGIPYLGLDHMIVWTGATNCKHLDNTTEFPSEAVFGFLHKE